MSEPEEVLAARVRMVIDSIGSAVPDQAAMGLPFGRHTRGPAAKWWMTAAALLLVVGGGWLVARGRSQSSSVLPAATTTSTTTVQQGTIAEWSSRIAGRTVSYRIFVGCAICDAGGNWAVVERDGSVVEATYLGEGERGFDVPSVPLSSALRFAAVADGPVVISDLSDSSIRLSVDVEANAIDDEFGVFVTDFKVVDDSSTPTTGEPS